MDAAMDAAEEPPPPPLYQCKIPPTCDAGLSDCTHTCWASTRDVLCTSPDEVCPFIGYTEVDCTLCDKPPVK
jgi:hypothetical protein